MQLREKGIARGLALEAKATLVFLIRRPKQSKLSGVMIAFYKDILLMGRCL